MKFQPSDSFAGRGRALEDEFFHARDQQLIANLRHELAELEEEHKLAHVSGVVEQQVLLDLVRAGVTGESLLAARLIPMVMVAWSDHLIMAEERAAILQAADADGIRRGTAAYDLLLHWLFEKPRPEVVQAWKAYVGELAKVAPRETVKSLRERTQRLCVAVARAGQGFWKLGRISPAKQALIDEFVKAWSPDKVAQAGAATAAP